MINRRMAHQHPNLDEPCAHDAPRWQEALPMPPASPSTAWPTWLIVLAEACFVLCLGALIYAACFAVQP